MEKQYVTFTDDITYPKHSASAAGTFVEPNLQVSSPMNSPDHLKSLSKITSKGSNNSEDAMIHLEAHLSKQLKRFYKSQTLEQFANCYSWIEKWNFMPTQKIYANMKDFKFFPSANTNQQLPLNQKKYEVSCLAINCDNCLAVGFDYLGIMIWDMKKNKEKILIKDPESYGKFSVLSIIMDKNYLYSGGDDLKIRKWCLQTGSCLTEFDGGHKLTVISLALSEEYLASGDNDGQIMLWELYTSSKKRLDAHQSPVTALILTQDKYLLFSCGQDKAIKAWNVKEGTLDFMLEGHSDIISCLALTVDETLLASGGNDNLVKVWDLSTKREKMRFEGHSNNITSLGFSPDGGLLVSGSFDRTINVWNVKKQELKKTLDGHTDQVTHLVISKEGRKIVSAGPDAVRVWNFDKDYEKHLLQGHKDFVFAIVVFPDNTKAISSGAEKKLMVWDLVKIKNIITKDEHSELVKIMTVSPDSSKFVSGDVSGRIIVWEAKRFEMMDDQRLFNKEIIFIRFFNNDNSRFIAICKDGSIKIFDTVARAIEKNFSPEMTDLTACELTYNDEYLALGSGSKFQIFHFDNERIKKANEISYFSCSITVIRSTQNSRFLVLGLENGNMQVFSLSSFNFSREISGSRHKILNLEIAKDNLTIIVSFEDTHNTIRLFDLETGEQVGLEDNQVHPVNTFSLTPDNAKIISTGAASHSLKITVLNKIKTKRIFKKHNKEIMALDITEDQTLLAAGSNDSTISIWNIKTFEYKNSLEGHTQKVLAVKFMKKQKRLVSGSADHTLKVWDLEKSACLMSFKKVGGWISDLVLTAEGDKAIVSCNQDGFVSVFDLNNKEKGKEILSQYRHENPVECVALSIKEEYCFSGDRSGLIKIYDLIRKAEVIKFKSHQGSCNAVIVVEIGKGKSHGFKLYSCGADKEIKIWFITSLFEVKLVDTLKGHSNEVLAITINPEGTRLYSASKDKSIFMWNLNNMKQIAELEGHHSSINALVVSNNGFHLFSGSDDKTIRVWNLRDSKALPFLDGHSEAISRLVLTSDQLTLISGGLDKLVIVWDLAKNKQLRTFAENDGHITGLAVTHNEYKVIVGTDGHVTKMFTLETGEKTEEFRYDLATCLDLALSKDDSKLFIGYSDSVIRIWNLLTHSFSISFEGHRGFVLCLLLNYYENRLISGSDDQTVIIWDIQKKEKILVLEGHEREVSAICLNRDEKFLFTGGGDKNVIVWDFQFGTIVKVLKDHINPVRSLAIGPDLITLVVACSPAGSTTEKRKNVYIYHINDNYKLSNKPEDNCKGCTSLLSSGMNKKLFLANLEKNIIVYDFEKMMNSPDSQSFMMIQSAGILSKNFLNKEFSKTFKGHSKKISAEVISSDNSYLAIADDDFIITVWDLIAFKRIACYAEHTGLIRAMITTSARIIISAGNDKSIGIWDLNRKEYDQEKRLQGHTGPVLALTIDTAEEILISSSEDQTIRVWDIFKRQQIRKYVTKPDIVHALYTHGKIQNSSNLTFLTGGYEGIQKWTIEAENEQRIDPISIMFLNSPVQTITMSPNHKILVLFLSSLKMQIWDFRSLTELRSDFRSVTLMCEFDCSQTRSKPVFLPNTEDRLMLYFNKIIDCFTGSVIFNFHTSHEILSFFFDFKSYLYISKDFELFQLNVNWLGTYLFKYLNNDCLNVLPKNPDLICDRKMSSLPFFFNFLHLTAIFDKSELLTKEKLKIMYADQQECISSLFSSLDIFLNTPLDILVQRKNPTFIVKYLKLLFEFFKDKSTSFYQKTRFFNYNFGKDYSFGHLLVDLTALLGDDLTVFQDLFDLAKMPLDPSIYDDSLIFMELVEPVLIETDSLYTNDKSFIEKQLKEEIQKRQNSVIDIDGLSEENKAIVKARIICLPDLNEINNSTTNDLYGIIGNLKANNEIFSNKTIEQLVDFIWRTQISFYYKIELVVFLVFFSLFNVNFLVLYQYRVNIYNYENQTLNNACNFIDVLIIVNSLYTLINELQQLSQGLTQYFKYIWNYFDISLIPLALAAAILDIMLIRVESFREHLPLIKVVYSVSMFCLWFRFLSFFRALKETSFMIRLIFNVLIGVKNFVLFMVIFILNMACSFYLLHTDTSGDIPSLWETIIIFYDTATGDTSGFDDYDLIISGFSDFYMIASSFLFAIMLMNLLVSIIGNFHEEIQQSEHKTRLYEKMNILCDTNSSLTTNIAKKFFPPKQIGTFLIELYNEKDEEGEKEQFVTLQKNIESDFDNKLNVTNEKIEDLRKSLNGFEKETMNLIGELVEIVKGKNNSGGLDRKERKFSNEENLRSEEQANFQEILREIKEVKRIFGK